MSLDGNSQSLRNEVLATRRRADEADRDAKDERRLRSLAAPAAAAAASASASGAGGIGRDDGDADDAPALRRKLRLATSETEALRTHANDLRDQIQAGWWSWRPAASGSETEVESVAVGEGRELSSGGWGADEAGVLGGAPGARAVAAAAAEAALLDSIGAASTAVAAGGGRGCNGSDISMELDRLTSLLAERDAQIGVLTSTVEALQTSPSPVLARASPRKSGVAAAAATAAARVDGGHNNAPTGSSAPSPRLRRAGLGGPRKAATASTAVSPSRGSLWDEGFGAPTMEAAAHGGVGVLNHVGAQGLARRCVALTVRLTSAIGREGKAERRAEQLAAEAARWERRVAAVAAAEAEVARRNRALESRGKEAAAALNGLRAESAARLREAGEEASKLR